jgi:hypothetical protein
MTLRAFSPEVVATIEMAKTVGWEYIGRNGAGHPRLRHSSGAVVDIAGTTSNFNTIENDRHRLWRVSGAPRQTKRAGKFRKGSRGSGFSLDAAVREQEGEHLSAYTTGVLKPSEVAADERDSRRPWLERELATLVEAQWRAGLRLIAAEVALAEAQRTEPQNDHQEMALAWKLRDRQRLVDRAQAEAREAARLVDLKRAEIEE